MRNIALTFLSLAFALAAAMPSIAYDIVELRPDDPVYVKLGQKIYIWINAQAVMA